MKLGFSGLAVANISLYFPPNKLSSAKKPVPEAPATNSTFAFTGPNGNDD